MPETDVGSVISEGQVSAIERAALRLDTDPLFRPAEVPADLQLVPQPPLTAVSMQIHDAKRTEERVISKNPHKAIRKPRKSFLSNPCNPRPDSEAGAADIILIIHEE
jgi:hypothetical protein